MKTVMKHNFSIVPDVKMQRSVFDLSHGHKTTFDGGYLVPVLCEEILPGDSFNVQSTFFGRLATPLTPFMDNMRLESFYFFVPNRLLCVKYKMRLTRYRNNFIDRTIFFNKILI